MKIKLKKYGTLERRLKKTTGEKLDVLGYKRLTFFLAGLDQYEEHDIDQAVLVFGRPGHTITLIPKDMDRLLVALGRLPGGVKALAHALGDLNVREVLTGPTSECRMTLVDGLLGAPKYVVALHAALMGYYDFHWYYHPEEVEAADREGRYPQQGSHYDVFHAGLFDLCRAVGAAQSALKKEAR